MSSDLQSALYSLSPDCPRDEWWRYLAAIKTELGEEGKEVAREWSQHSDSYKGSDFEATWRSLKPGHIGIGTIIFQAKRSGYLSATDYQWKPPVDDRPKPIEKPRETSLTFPDALASWNRVLRGDEYVAEHPYCRSREIGWAAGAGRGVEMKDGVVRNRDCILVPQYSYPEEQFIGVECILPNGCKWTLGNKGILILGNDLDSELPQLIVEGWATGARLFLAYEGNCCIYVCGGKGQFEKTRQLVEAQHPNRKVIVIGEVDV